MKFDLKNFYSKKLAVLSSIAVGLILIVSSNDQSEALTYTPHDGSVDDYLKKIKVSPYSNKKDTWTYIVSACATDRTIAVAGIVLKSDIDKVTLGVNKNIPKGECSYYGAVMKAKDGKTLGAELIQKHEALSRMEQIIKDSPKMTKSTRDSAMSEFNQLFQMTGFIPRL